MTQILVKMFKSLSEKERESLLDWFNSTDENIIVDELVEVLMEEK